MAAAQPGATAICWGCGLEVALPGPSADFKCGWCGAITLEKQQHRSDPRCLRWFWLRDLVISSALGLLVLLLVVGGVSAIFPVVFPSFSSPTFYLHSAIVCLVAFNIYFNFWAAARGSPGMVPPLPFGSASLAPQGALEDCTFCARCERPKPSKAHHCRACRTCVMGMDHHCPFIANCVGADNQRAFMLLLLYAILGCLYAMCMGTWALCKLLPEVTALSRDGGELWNGFPDKMPTVKDVLGLLFLVRVRVSVRLVATFYLTFLSFGVVIAAGFLLKQQLDGIFLGETAIDAMRRVPVVIFPGDILPGKVVENTWAGRLRKLDRVLGRGRGGRRWHWFLPRWPRTGHVLEHKKAG